MKKSIFTLLFAVFVLFAIPASAQTFAQLAMGGGYEPTLTIINKTDLPWRGTIYLYRGASTVNPNTGLYDNPWPGLWTGYLRGLPAHGTHRGEIQVRIEPGEVAEFSMFPATGFNIVQAGHLRSAIITHRQQRPPFCNGSPEPDLA